MKGIVRDLGIGCAKHTWVCVRDRLGVNVAKVVSDGRTDGHSSRADATNDDGPEDGRSLAGCPGAVLERGGPEVRCGGRHDGRERAAILGGNEGPTLVWERGLG